MVPKAGIEPARREATVFETVVSTNSTTSAWEDDYIVPEAFVKSLSVAGVFLVNISSNLRA